MKLHEKKEKENLNNDNLPRIETHTKPSPDREEINKNIELPGSGYHPHREGREGGLYQSLLY